MLDGTLPFIVTCRQVVGVVSASSGRVSDARMVECRECLSLNTVYFVSMVAVMCAWRQLLMECAELAYDLDWLCQL